MSYVDTTQDTSSNSDQTTSGVTTTTTAYKRTYIRTFVDYLPDQTLRVSTVNPRYLVKKDGTPVVLVGFHTWGSVQDGDTSDPPAAFDWDAFLAACVSYGCNFTKLWTSETARGWADITDTWWYPPRYERTGPGNDNDSKLKFDLTQINTTWLDRLEARALDCQNNGIYVCVQLFQGWQIENKGYAGAPWTYHPYEAANNINSVDGDQDNNGQGTETHYNTGANVVLSYQQDLVTAVIDRLNYLDNVIWEISNEDTLSTANTGWQSEMIAFIYNYELTKPKQHPIGMTKPFPGTESTANSAVDGSGANWVCYGPLKADAVHNSTDPVSFYDTDHTVGLSSDYTYIWQALCNGHGGSWYMDEWDGVSYGEDTRNNATYILIRANLGYVLTLTNLLNDLLGMTPQPSLCSTGYCLAKDHATQAEYICFQGGTGNFTLDLSTATGTLNIRWLRCSNGATSTDTVSGGDTRTLTPPWAGVVVAYVYH